MKPQRIQIKRVKGFSLQKVSKELNGLEAVSCARPHLFGNPYTEKEYGREAALENFKKLANDSQDFIQFHLRGKNLACFCKLSDECHVDTLLELANK